MIASGAGAFSRWSLGTAIFGGLAIATVLSLLFVPNLYIIIKNFEESVLKGGQPPKGGDQHGKGGPPDGPEEPQGPYQPQAPEEQPIPSF